MVIEILLFNACIVVVPSGCWQQPSSLLCYVLWQKKPTTLVLLFFFPIVKCVFNLF